ncbi:class I SAM-dependent methyltransferase [Nitrospirillum sp. BR 11164]|uniref:class I SAM-dependent methyltransferase n=1 Tax=Nitrospirillum sp. BR 11164 TaxID=3104324 RepID=UPI002AFF733D|nr:class I SAM-dependent methyltransferase [Nitrospirillum sp. BR 11164]MEA1648065.1 class I SAM-dependent methyltransferase [Nitrospirillum sp. BR 11164]
MALAIEDRAALDFVLSLRRHWAGTVYPRLRADFDAAAPSPALVNDPESLAPLVHGLPTYPWFSWLERGSQKMLWRAVSDAVVREGALKPAPDGPATVEVDPNLVLPDWYTDWDIHLQPGGVWSHDLAGRIYEMGARLVMLGENDDYAFHRLFVETALPKRPYRRMIDLGCGFGKSTWSLKQAYPEAEVIGVELGRPCVELAARRASERKLAVRFRQADAVATGLETGSADLVTSTMFVHEVPDDVLPAIFTEAARLLAPGGVLRFLDFQRTGDGLRDLAMVEHGARNNEPFLPPMIAADLPAMAAAAGLVNARWVAFDERGSGRLPDLSWPSRAEWHFPWAVLEAEKPQ